MAKSTIATAYVQVRPSMDGVAAEVRKQYDPAGTSAGASFGANMVGSLKKYISVAAVGKVLKDSIMAGGALQQSLGGVETLFKDSASTVIANAQNAYKTAGLSANAYMETVTSFSASLLQSLGGDTAAAAEVANMALVDMSDNANKMGTSMELIQNAYQGFAKQNYTMLDNLKLGYGGTKTEMQRLLADAQKLTGVKYDINNLSDVYNAIHAIQEELGITGTTALEASTTLIGSFNSMKAAFTDVLSYLSLGMDVTPALNALVETVSTFLIGNLLPMVFNIVTALPSAIFTFIQALIPSNVLAVVTNLVSQLTTFITTSLPQILANGDALISELTNGFFDGIPNFMSTTADLLSQVFDALIAVGPEMAASGLALISELATGALSNLPAILTAVTQLLSSAVAGILAFLPQLLASGGALIIELAAGLVGAIPSVIASIPQIISTIVSTFSGYDWGSIGTEMMNGIVRGIQSGVGAILSAAQSAALSALRAAKRALGIASPSKVMRDKIGKFIPAGIAVGIKANTDSVSNAMKGLSTITADSFNADLRYTPGTPATTVRGNTQFNFYVYGSEGQSVEELAEIVMEKIHRAIAQKEAVYG